MCCTLAISVTQPKLQYHWLCQLDRGVTQNEDRLLCTTFARPQLAGDSTKLYTSTHGIAVRGKKKKLSVVYVCVATIYGIYPAAVYRREDGLFHLHRKIND